ncbi:thioredoxin domain-containing protein [Craterilacuibacter sp. RT1T]|uniref:DsbA family protein n=1 Tax=Craterilacuibacter sp. RT1T TaxID=2942211 RepID=UPI0020BECAEE|nr:DsbA family protein [Craterilacuibacter sp. RT1T]
MKNKLLLGGSVVLAIAAFFIASALYQSQQSEKMAAQPRASSEQLIRMHAPVYGPSEAKVVIVEFSDPACETCAAMSPVLKDLVAQYPGKVKIVLRYAALHQGAEQIVRMLEAARLQKPYWPLLEVLYQNQAYWAAHHQADPDKVAAIMMHEGVDMTRLAQDMNSDKIRAIAAQDEADRQALKVDMTPGLFVNGRPLTEFGVGQLKALVADEVSKAYPN